MVQDGAATPTETQKTTLSQAKILVRSAGHFSGKVIPLLLPFLGLVFVSLVASLLKDEVLIGVVPTFEGYYEVGQPDAFFDLRARLAWATALLVYIILLTGMLLIAGAVMLERLMEPRGRWVAVAGIGVAIAIAGALFAFSPITSGFVLDAALLDKLPNREAAHQLVEVQDAMTIITIALAAVAVGLLTGAPDHGTSATVLELGRAVATVRGMLYLSAGVLVAGVLCVYTLYEFAQVWAPPTGLQEDSGALSLTVSGSAGFVYSAILVGIFAPGFAMLQSHGRRLARRECGDCQTEDKLVKWMRENAIMPSIPERVRTALAVLAPLLTGPGAALLQFLGG